MVLQVILDVRGQSELCLQFECLAVGASALGEISAGCIVDVQYAVVALVGLQFALHSSQFAADDDETLVDELSGVDSHLVLVANGILVVDGDEHVEHILGACRGSILEGEGEDAGLVLFLTYAQIGQIIRGYGRDGQLEDLYLLAHPVLGAEAGGSHHHAHSTYAYRLVHGHHLGGDTLLSLHVGDAHMLTVHHSECEGDGHLGCGIGEGDADGCMGVELVGAQSVLILIVDIGMYALHHLLHEFLGTELEDLVGHVDLIDIVVIAVQSGRIGLVGRVLDDYGSLSEIGERCA